MDTPRPSSPGTRHRFVTPAAPAPVPASDAQRSSSREAVREEATDNSLLLAPPSLSHSESSAPEAEESSADASAVAPRTTALKERAPESAPSGAASGDDRAQKQSDSDVVRSTGSMAIATLFSRLTGFLRTVLITATLGGAIASAFNTANTLPNLITEIVLGAVLTSLVVPVLVRAEKEDPDRGEAFIRRLFTLSATLLGSITILAVVAAPLLTRTMLDKDGEVNLIQSTSFAYLLLPQIFFYGIFSLLMAVLNTKGVFKPGAWAPVANNVISIVVLLAYYFVPGSLHPSDPTGLSDPHILLLGLGTTLGVIVQALIMVPPIRKAGISLKPLWGIDDRLKQFGGMAIAIVVYVAISQLGYIVTTRIASSADAEAPAIYQQAWLLLQVPYGIIGVTLLTAIMPRLSRNAADGDEKGVVRDLVMGSKLTFLALIPIVVFFTAFGVPIAKGLFAWGAFSEESASILGFTLSFSAFTLLPYALVLLHLRVFYAREEAWLPTFIIGGITVTKIVLSFLAPMVASSPERVVVLLGFANGFGFISGAVIGAVLLRRKLGNLGSREVARTCGWALGASLVGVLVALGLSWLLTHSLISLLEPLGSLRHIVHVAITGVVFLVVTGIVLSRSKLDEVIGLGRALQRIPGMNKIIKIQAPTEAELGGTSAPAPREDRRVPVEFSAESMAFDATFNATPVPPPMSAGVVRGPRLVPGAEVADGSYRLLADHGSAPGARFWHAREKETGREVALTFIDTTGQAPKAPATEVEAKRKAGKIVARTRKLADANKAQGSNAPVAGNIKVYPYPTGALVVADWTPGRSLASVAESNPDPYAAALAFKPLADASQDHLLGLDNRARIRISTAGIAVLAFPGVLDDASRERDIQAVRSGISQLMNSDEVPEPVAKLLTGDAALLPEGLRKLHAELYPAESQDTAAQDANPVKDAEEDGNAEPVVAPQQKLHVTEERAPKPESAPGFGSKGYSRGAGVVLGLAAITMVVVAAVITAYLTSLFAGDEETTPVNPGAIVGSETSQAPRVKLVLPIAEISAWSENIADVDEQSQNETALVIDEDADTGWAVRQDQGLLVRVDEKGYLSQLVVRTEGNSPVDVKVYGVPASAEGEASSSKQDEQLPELTIDSLKTLPLLAEETLDSRRTKIELPGDEQFVGILMMVESSTDANAIQDLTLVGS